MGIPDHLTCLLRNLHPCQKQPLELDLEQWTGSKLGKEYLKAVYCDPAYLTCMQSSSREIPGWEISVTSDMQMTQALWQKGKKN